MLQNSTFYIHYKYFYLRIIIFAFIFIFACSRETNVKDIRTLFQQGKYEAVQSLLERFLFNNPYDVSGIMLQCELSVVQKHWNSAFIFYDSLRIAMKNDHRVILEKICREFLLDGVTAASSEIRQTAVNVLSKLDEPSFIPLYAKGLTDSSHNIRSECAQALGFTRTFSTIPVLRIALTDQDLTTKLYSAAALYVMGEEKETIPLLQDIFLSNNFVLQHNLLDLLKPVRRPSILSLLKIAYGSPAPDIRLQVVEHIAQLGHQPLAFNYLETLINHIDELPEPILARAMDVLGTFSYPPAQLLLERIAAGQHSTVSLTAQLFAQRAMAKQKHVLTGFSPDQFIRNQDTRIQLLAAEIAYYINPAEGRRLLSQLLSKKVYDSEFLCRLDDPLIAPLLKETLSEASADQKIEIILCLAHFHDLSALSQLLYLCQSGNRIESYRAAGAVLQVLKTYQVTKI